MDYSNVTTEQLRSKRDGLFVDLGNLIAEEDLLSIQVSEIEAELDRRSVSAINVPNHK